MPQHLSLSEMAQRIRQRRLSPVELAEAHLRQIEKHNPKLNAFVGLFADEARQVARDREAELARGREPGPLHGVPVTVKDSFDVAGVPTLCGSRLREGHRAARDSTAAARLRAAGAVLLGKTNCPEFLMNYETDNYVTGRTNNPWDLERTPGGSSGGEAAAIAAFCSAGGVGSDGGGSIRVPAHFCGIVGLKPTPGRVPATGHYPEIAHPGGLLGVAGPLARTVADVRLLFSVLAGHDPLDPFSAPVPLREMPSGDVRIGAMEQLGGVPVEAPIREAVRGAASLLRSLGHTVEPFASPVLERAAELWKFFFQELPLTVMRDLLAGQRDKIHWSGAEMFEQVMDKPEPSGKQVLENLVARDKLRARLLGQMEEHRVLLWPACGVVAFRHRQRRWETPERTIDYGEAMRPLTPVNLLGLPAVVLPFQVTPGDLPVGIQLVGRPYEEELLLELAARLEEARGPLPGPPGF